MADSEVHPGRFTARLDDNFVVFLIGARFHKPWKLHRWLPVAKAMSTMQREIAAHPEIGCLHIENYGALRPISVQYWRSFDHLERFARSSDWSHLAAWRRYNRLLAGNSEVGIWHETFRIPAGSFEAVYGDTARMGLARAGDHISLSPNSSAAQRLGVRPGDVNPVEEELSS